MRPGHNKIVLAREIMDGLQNHVEATTSLEAQGVLSFEIIVDACLPAVVERDLANALRSHLEDERHCELSGRRRRRSMNLLVEREAVTDTDTRSPSRDLVGEAR